jgi:hypothetical protein
METEKLSHLSRRPIHQVISNRSQLSVEDHKRALARTPTPNRFDKNRQRRLLQLKLKRDSSAAVSSTTFSSNGPGVCPEASEEKNIDETVGIIHSTVANVPDAVESSMYLRRAASKEEHLHAFARTPTLKRFDKQFEQRRQERLLRGHFLVIKNIVSITAGRNEKACADLPHGKNSGYAPASTLDTVDLPRPVYPINVPQKSPTSQENRNLEEMISMARRASPLVAVTESQRTSVPSDNDYCHSAVDGDNVATGSNICALQ